jgi:hypothetical protein
MTTRREALGLIGLATGSVLLGSLATGQALAGAEKTNCETAALPFPWPYRKLDPVACAERSYKAFYEENRHCMYGAFLGIIGEYAEAQGAPYCNFPYKMMTIGGGGGGDWATLCGALNGAMLAVSLLTKTPKPVVDELFSWYETEQLPNYRPAGAKMAIVTSVSKSPLCHISVSRWCKVARVKAFSDAREERCAQLTASVVKKAVELLNAQSDGSFKAAYPLPKYVQECRSCHDKKSMLENTRGKMQCAPCHADLKAEHPKI